VPKARDENATEIQRSSTHPLVRKGGTPVIRVEF
jgi:hypothetical protein